MQLTGNYKLKKPEGTDIVNIENLNDNMDVIDAKLKQLEDNDVSADRSLQSIQSNLDTHISDKSNPHNVTRAQLGLENVLNVAKDGQLVLLLEDVSNTILPHPVSSGPNGLVEFSLPPATKKVSFHWSGSLSASSGGYSSVSLVLNGGIIASKVFAWEEEGQSGTMFDEITPLVDAVEGANVLEIISSGTAQATCDRIVKVGVGVNIA